MDAKVRQRQIKAARRRKMENARGTMRDEEFGISVVQRSKGTRIEWMVDQDPYVALVQLDRLRKTILLAAEAELVTELRLAGTSWADIGWCMGITGEAVRKRLGVLDERLMGVDVDGEEAPGE